MRKSIRLLAVARRVLGGFVFALALLAMLPALASARPPAGYGAGAGYCAAHGNHTNGISFDNVYACATVYSNGFLPFDEDESAPDQSFQCVELSARFLWAIYGIWAGPGSGVNPGAGLVSVVHSAHRSIPVGHPGPGSVPVAGDVASFGPGGAVDADVGHTAVVIWSNPTTGEFKIMSENWLNGDDGIEVVWVNLQGQHNGRVKFSGDPNWTTASWLELTKTPPTTTTTPTTTTPTTTTPTTTTPTNTNPTQTPHPIPTPGASCDAAVTSAGYTTPCDYSVGNYKVYGTGSDGLYQHTGPGTSYSKVTNPNTLAEGTAVHIACQLITSSTVNGSGVWDLETDGYWVSDYYIDTPDIGKYSPGLSQCQSTGG